MKNGLLLCAAVFFACAGATASVASTVASQVSRPPSAAATQKTPAATAHFQIPVLKVKVAPADEYFGRQKLSILGINNTIHDTNLRIGFDRVHATKYYGQLATAQDSLLDWARKYPQDTWLPGRAYYMSHVFWQMHSNDGDSAANKCRALLFRQFPKSRWAVLAKRETRDIVAPETATDVATQNAPGAANASATGTNANATSANANAPGATTLNSAAAEANASNAAANGATAATGATKALTPAAAPAAPAKSKH